MWCFFDESHPTEGGVTSIVACLMRSETIRDLDAILYKAQRRHWVRERAKNLRHELKGSMLLSNNSFKMLGKYGHSTNQEIAKDILQACTELTTGKSILVFGAAVYGEKDILRRVSEDRLAFPVVEILRRVSSAAREMEPTRLVNIVFDESLADRDASITVRRFVGGVHLANVSNYPLIGVSHVTPGIQLADIGAYILGRRAAGDERFARWITRLRQLEWTGQVDGYQRMGIQRWDGDGYGNMTVRKKWA